VSIDIQFVSTHGRNPYTAAAADRITYDADAGDIVYVVAMLSQSEILSELIVLGVKCNAIQY